jgi:hypothetical protein
MQAVSVIAAMQAAIRYGKRVINRLMLPRFHAFTVKGEAGFEI